MTLISLDTLGVVGRCFVALPRIQLINRASGMLSGQFTATRAPAGLQNLIIADSPASVPLLQASTDTILRQNPEVAAIIQKHAEAGTFADPGYLAATQVLHKKHFCTIDPMPEDLMTSALSIMRDPTVFSAMCALFSPNTSIQPELVIGSAPRPITWWGIW